MNTNAMNTEAHGDVRPTLLIADDDGVVRSMLPAQLGGDFNVVAVAENATEAVELADEHQPDAALIDVEMPGGGARHAVPQIATRSPETCIVVLSADESREVVLELLNAGAIAYVRTGVTGAQIAKTLADAMKAKGNHPQA